ncbi:hypothetical protein [Paraburkholderia graminis]|uniref:hypothetical protein n=1 Tax=Paraburkholderia graminis TaxID=60548 RepID=UPI002794995E|nr:hypothetical protein [Paraburkholderia graminis]MDQ0627109.1 hypothetical protein [Paraburkholderia graminis]
MKVGNSKSEMKLTSSRSVRTGSLAIAGTDATTYRNLAAHFVRIRELLKVEKPEVSFCNSFGLLAHVSDGALGEDDAGIPTDASVLFAAVGPTSAEGRNNDDSTSRFNATCFQDSGHEYVEMTFEAPGHHVTWLADASDAEVWQALASWAREGWAYVCLRGAHENALHHARFDRSESSLSRPWSTLQTEDVAHMRAFLSFATGVADSSLIHASAPKTVCGHPLRCSSVNVLLTELTRPLVPQTALHREHEFIGGFLAEPR